MCTFPKKYFVSAIYQELWLFARLRDKSCTALGSLQMRLQKGTIEGKIISDLNEQRSTMFYLLWATPIQYCISIVLGCCFLMLTGRPT